MIVDKTTPAPDADRRERLFLALDIFERILVIVLFVFLAQRIVDRYLETGNAVSLVLLPSEGLVVVFMLIRRRTQNVTVSALEWITAFAATCAPMLVAPGDAKPLIWPPALGVVSLMGTIVQLHAKLHLGRSFGCVPAHRGLQLAGPYQFVRHPMYAGYLVSHLAFLMINPTLRNLGVYVLTYALLIPRILMEERILGKDPGYRAYMDAVRWRLFPRIF